MGIEDDDSSEFSTSTVSFVSSTGWWGKSYNKCPYPARKDDFEGTLGKISQWGFEQSLSGGNWISGAKFPFIVVYALSSITIFGSRNEEGTPERNLER